MANLIIAGLNKNDITTRKASLLLRRTFTKILKRISETEMIRRCIKITVQNFASYVVIRDKNAIRYGISGPEKRSLNGLQTFP